MNDYNQDGGATGGTKMDWDTVQLPTRLKNIESMPDYTDNSRRPQNASILKRLDNGEYMGDDNLYDSKEFALSS